MINSNDCWQLDLLVQVRLFMDSFRMVGVKKDNLTPTQHLFGQVLCMVNLKTRYVFLQVLPSRTFDSIKTGVQYFLNLLNINSIKIFSDAELSFRKMEKIHGDVKASRFRKINFAQSRAAKELIEQYSIQFITHQSYKPTLTGTIERLIGSLKNSFQKFQKTILSFSEGFALINLTPQ